MAAQLLFLKEKVRTKYGKADIVSSVSKLTPIDTSTLLSVTALLRGLVPIVENPRGNLASTVLTMGKRRWVLLKDQYTVPTFPPAEMVY